MDLTRDEFNSILENCCFLKEKFGGDIKAYVIYRPEIEIDDTFELHEDNVEIHIASLKSVDGDYILDRLHSKIKNKEDFTLEDQINHLLLLYMGHKSWDEFLPKYQQYMMAVMLYNAEKQGIEVVRLD